MIFLKNRCAFCSYRPGTFHRINLAIVNDNELAWYDLCLSSSTYSYCYSFTGSISGPIPLFVTTLGCTGRASGGASWAIWIWIAQLNNLLSFLSLSNWMCKPEIEFYRSSALRFLFAVISIILFRRRTIAWSSGKCSGSCRCWRQSSSACSIKLSWIKY